MLLFGDVETLPKNNMIQDMINSDNILKPFGQK